MKQIAFYLVFFILSGGLMAQNADNKWALGLEYGTLQYKGDLGDQINDMDDWKDGFYFSLIRYLSPSWEGVLNMDYNIIDESGPITTEANRFLGKFVTGEFNLRYKFNNGYIFKENSLFQPFLSIGTGYMGGNASGKSFDKGGSVYDKSAGSANLYYGLGTKIKINDRISWQVEYGEVRIIKDDLDEATTLRDGNDFFRRIKTGLIITLGKAKDSDGDGVADRKDECPETPTGISVDEKGCPVDTDGDGVADYIDDCPTIAGIAALKGCPDTDGDGIADKDDECPEVAGVKELKGCPDADGDGITDAKDECADTPKGWKVDDKGCPVDTDGDGIVDDEDACPTVAGIVEEKGCPEKEPEIVRVPIKSKEKIESVYFVIDKSYLTNYSKKKLNNLISILKNNPNYLLDVYGHTDDTADEDYNLKLSQRRINSVIKYLNDNSIDSSRILETKAFGESKPADTNKTVEGRQKNRRVEFQLIEEVTK